VVGSLVSERCPVVAPQLYRRPTALGYGEEVELSAGIGSFTGWNKGRAGRTGEAGLLTYESGFFV
jgi:hypothetical protein